MATTSSLHGHLDPSALTPAERRAEIVLILARAFLRYQARQSEASAETLSDPEGHESLEAGSETRMSGSRDEN